jgi:limonene-1,2-epoxide hydrolase
MTEPEPAITPTQDHNLLIQVARNFFQAISSHDLDAACALLSEDFTYTNGIGFAVLHGIPQFRYIYAPVVSGPPTRMEIHRVTASGTSVAVEREDVQVRTDENGEQREIRLPGMASLDISPEGRITAWRDYYDMEAWCRAIGRPYEHFQTWFNLAAQVSRL